MNHKKNDYPSSSQQLTMFEREAPYSTPEPVAKEAPLPRSVTAKPDTSANRKGYKLTKLGWIPEEWNIIQLSKYFKIANGQVDPKKEPYKKMPLIAPNHVESNTGIVLEKVTAGAQQAISGKYLFDAGDVVYSKIRPYLNKAFIADEPGLCSADMYPFKPLSDLNNRFLLAVLLNSRFLNFARSVSYRTGIPKINRDELDDYLHPLPPLPEQRAIADCLSTWDQAIQTLTQLIAQKELRKKWLMQQLLTGKRRLPEFDGEWSTWSFKEILKEVKRPVNWNDEELYNLISVRRRSGGLFHRESLHGHQIKTKNLRTAKSGDFLISKMQIVHGASGLTTDGFDGMKISGSYIAVRARNESILNTEFLNWYSKLPHFYHQCYISSYGVHIEKMTFDFKLFLKEEISLPPLEEQTAITQVLQRADQELTLLNQKLIHLQDQKKGLMQQLLTGKKRLKITKDVDSK